MGLFDPNRDLIDVDPAYQVMMRELALDARAVFDDRRIVPWRKLADRENCTLDAFVDGRKIRLHVKRYPRDASPAPAIAEHAGYQLLLDRGIPAAPLVAWGVLTDRRSFTIWQDLGGYTPGDKLLEQGVDFEPLLKPTAVLAGRLHAAGLHHRDLYLCHFMVRPAGSGLADTSSAARRQGGIGDAVQLIDTARVRPLPRWPLRRRWIVKDLAQFWYSTARLPVTDDQRDRWLQAYAGERGIQPQSLRGAIVRKARSIGRHDAKLNARQPARNISIPT